MNKKALGLSILVTVITFLVIWLVPTIPEQYLLWIGYVSGTIAFTGLMYVLIDIATGTGRL